MINDEIAKKIIIKKEQKEKQLGYSAKLVIRFMIPK
jgi:hypothetical protein